MAIARSFREGWLTSLRIDGLRDDGAELFLFRLGLKADKNGVFFGDPELLRGAVYPLQTSRRRLADVTRYRDMCARAGLIRLWIAEDGREYVQILRWRQKTPSEKRIHPLPPGEPDDGGQESLPLSLVNGIEEKSPQSPPPAGGGKPRLDGMEPRRRRRLPGLDVLREELGGTRDEIAAILRPGGCAYQRSRTEMGEQRWAQLEKLRERERGLLDSISRTRDALAVG